MIAVLCLSAALLAQRLRREVDAARDVQARLPTAADFVQPLQSVLKHPVLRRVALSTFIFSIVQAALTSFLVSFLTADLHWTLVQAGAASAVAQGSAVFGRVLWGAVADRLPDGSRRMLLALATAMALAGLAMAALSPSTHSAVVLLLLGRLRGHGRGLERRLSGHRGPGGPARRSGTRHGRLPVLHVLRAR